MLNRLDIEFNDLIYEKHGIGIHTVYRDRCDLGSPPLEMIWGSVNDMLEHTRKQTGCKPVPIVQVHLLSLVLVG